MWGSFWQLYCSPKFLVWDCADSVSDAKQSEPIIKRTTKQKFKTGFKLTAFSSPAIVALIAAPAETFAFLKMLKEAGFELPAILAIAGIAWWLRKDVVKIMDVRMVNLTNVVENFGDKLDENTKEQAERTKLSEERWGTVNAKFMEQGNEIKELATEIKTSVKEIARNSEQVRYLYTAYKLPHPEEKSVGDQDLTIENSTVQIKIQKSKED